MVGLQRIIGAGPVVGWRCVAPGLVVGPAVGGIIPAYETSRHLGVPAIWVEREEGRLLDLRATLRVEGRVTARASAQFASMAGR